MHIFDGSSKLSFTDILNGIAVIYGLDHWEVEKFKAWSYSRNCANDPVILAVFVGLRGYMYNPIK